ncbi:MAG: ABC transporter permease [Ignavibacteria bacterium]|jgi:ABC-2 type transport system permease protein
MINQKVTTIIKREIKTKLLSKGFVAMTVLIPVFLIGVLALQTYFMSIESDDFTSLIVVAESQGLSGELQKEIENDETFNKNFSFQYEVKDSSQMNDFIELKKEELLKGELTGIVFVSGKALRDKRIKYFSKNPSNISLFNKIDDVLNQALLNLYFSKKDLSEEDLSYARSWVDIKGFRVSEKDEIEEEGYGNRILSFLFSFLLYLSLLFLGSMMMQSVIEEKSNRVVEVLLSSINSHDFMKGKIFGNAITGILQMVVWLSPLMLLISTTWFILPKEFVLSIDWSNIVFYLINYSIGLTTFLGLFTCVGSMFDNSQDAQQGMWPIILLVMIPFFMSFTLQNNPDSSFAIITSITPVTSLIIMPARITMVDVPFFQLLLSQVMNLLFLVFVFYLAGKIYRVGILATGSKPTLAEIINWIKN